MSLDSVSWSSASPPDSDHFCVFMTCRKSPMPSYPHPTMIIVTHHILVSLILFIPSLTCPEHSSNVLPFWLPYTGYLLGTELILKSRCLSLKYFMVVLSLTSQNSRPHFTQAENWNHQTFDRYKSHLKTHFYPQPFNCVSLCLFFSLLFAVVLCEYCRAPWINCVVCKVLYK